MVETNIKEIVYLMNAIQTFEVSYSQLLKSLYKTFPTTNDSQDYPNICPKLLSALKTNTPPYIYIYIYIEPLILWQRDLNVSTPMLCQRQRMVQGMLYLWDQEACIGCAFGRGWNSTLYLRRGLPYTSVPHIHPTWNP